MGSASKRLRLAQDVTATRDKLRPQSELLQTVASFDSEGGIAKMVANKLAVTASGKWLLPFWREMGGHDCTHAPAEHGKAGVLVSSDKVSYLVQMCKGVRTSATCRERANPVSRAFELPAAFYGRHIVFTQRFQTLREKKWLSFSASPGRHLGGDKRGAAAVQPSNLAHRGFHSRYTVIAAAAPGLIVFYGTLTSGLPSGGSEQGFVQLFRTQVGSIFKSESADGSQWSGAKPVSLPNPNSKVRHDLRIFCLLVASPDQGHAKTHQMVFTFETPNKNVAFLADRLADASGWSHSTGLQ